MILSLSIGGMSLLSALFVWMGFRSRSESMDDYITHRGRVSALGAGYSLAASVLGAWILFSPVETGSWAGVSALFAYALGQGMPLFLLAFFGPALIRILPEGYGLSDYIFKRYGRRSALITSAVMLFYMGTFLTAELTAIAQVFQMVFGTPMLLSCTLIMALVFAYVFRGGLGASIKTDKIQLYVLVPLLLTLSAAVFTVMGRKGPVLAQIREQAPQLLSPVYGPGWSFGVVLFIGITASNLFYQAFWQRVYSIKSSASGRTAFLVGGFITIPLVFLAGFFGILAVGAGTLDPSDSSLGLFTLLPLLTPVFTVITVVLAFALVMSSIDSSVNGMVSTITSWKGVDRDDPSLLRRAQILTVIIGMGAVLIGSRGYSVLYLFLVANLISSAFAFPLLFGLFNSSIKGRGAMTAGFSGLILGAPFFPAPDFTSWSGLPAEMLIAYLTALAVSTLLSLIFGRAGGGVNG